jgi:hypothetical protein
MKVMYTVSGFLDTVLIFYANCTYHTVRYSNVVGSSGYLGTFDNAAVLWLMFVCSMVIL